MPGVKPGQSSQFAWFVAVLVAASVALLPLDANVALAELAFSNWNVPQRLYQLIKPTILWAPVGLIAGLAGYRRLAQYGGYACVLGFAVIAPLVTDRLFYSDIVEIMGILPGLALGLWLGERSHLSAQLQSSDRPGDAPAREAVARPVQQPRRADDSRLEIEAEIKPRLPALLYAGRIIAVCAIAMVAWALVDFPRWNVVLGIGLIGYIALLWRYPRAWLIIVPAALPLLDLAFWTGRFYFDEFDLLVVATFSVWLWRGVQSAGLSARLTKALWLLVVAVLLSTLFALFPWQPLDDNAFSTYWSQYNGLRVAKGFLWGLLLFVMARQSIQPGNFRLLAFGMATGLLGVAIAAIWETWLFTGFSGATDYRVTATFSSMHTGGGHIEAYLAVALPFAWYLLISQQVMWVRLAAGLAFLLGTYTILTTVARGGLLAFSAIAIVLAAVSFRQMLANKGQKFQNLSTLLLITVGVAILGIGIAGGAFLQQRIEQTRVDAGTRIEHWAAAVAMKEPTLKEWLIGAGLGSFPRRFLFANADLELGAYSINGSADDAYLSLNSGGTLYMAQAVEIAPDTRYTVTMDVRSPGQAKTVEFSLCEKKLFNSRRCAWGGVRIATNSADWAQVKRQLDSEKIGAGAWLVRPPVQFSLYNPEARTTVDIDNVRLLGPNGVDLLTNGDFEQGLDRWFFKSGDHLPWHIKNLWVHLLFEQGLLGLFAVALLMSLAFFRLISAAWRGDMVATALLASLAGFLVLSMVDTLVDAPRLAALLVVTLLLGAGYKQPIDLKGPASE